MPRHTVAEVARVVGGELRGPGQGELTGLGSLDRAGPTELSHLSAPAYRAHLSGTGAGAVLLRAADAEACPVPAIVVADPYLAYARATHLFAPAPEGAAGVHPEASVADGAQLDEAVSVAAGAVVETGAWLGPAVRVGPGAWVGSGVRVGAGSEVGPGVRLYPRTRIGARCRIHAGAVLGAPGFGFTPDEQGRWTRIEQLGGVVLGDDVDVGANTTIDCGAIDDTVIGDGVKIDNQVQIGHNSRIGEHTLICGCTGIVGSSVIGRHCVLAGGVGIGGDGPVTLCDGVIVSGMTHVSRSLDVPGTYSGGVLHAPNGEWKRNALRFGQLDRWVRDLRDLARRVRALEGSAAGSRGGGGGAPPGRARGDTGE